MNKKLLIALGIFVVLLVGGYSLAKYIAIKNLKENIEKTLQTTPSADYKIKIKEYDYNLFTSTPILKDITVEFPEGKVKIKEIKILKWETPEGYFYPTLTEITAKDCVLFPKNGETFKYDFYQKVSYNQQNKRFYVEKMKVISQNLDVNFSMVFDNVDESLFKQKFTSSKENVDKVLKIIPKKFIIEYKEKGLISKIIKDIAERKNTTPDRVKSKILTTLEKDLKESYGNEKDILNAFYQLIKNEKGYLIIDITNKSNKNLVEVITSYMILGTDSIEKNFNIKVSYKNET